MTNPTAAKDDTDRAYYPQEDQDGRRRLAEKYPVSEHGNCMAISDRTLGCTRPTGHDGPHVAHVSSREAAQIWPNTRRVAPNPPTPTRVIHVGDNPPTAEQVQQALGKCHLCAKGIPNYQSAKGGPFYHYYGATEQVKCIDKPSQVAAPAPIGLDTPPEHVDQINDEWVDHTPQGKGAEGGHKDDDQGCSMAARTDLGHGKNGHCDVRNEPCPPACLLKQIGHLEAEIATLKLGEQAIGESAVPSFLETSICVCRCGNVHPMPASEPTGDATPQVTAEEAREWLRSPEIFQMRWTNSHPDNQLSSEDRECLLLAAFANRALASRTAKEN